ncbi:MAG TPA: creatininase family protein [Candidatus Methylomirabilis sp.]|nr:creatininase family protein [Candidatus Methylomirabilis sp.]
MIQLAERTWPEARILARDPRTVVLLPLGAVEEHGPHLPLLVDWLGSEELARRMAPHLRRAGYRPVLAPAIPYGVSTLAADWSGTVSLSVATLRRLIVEVIQSLARHGFRRFVLANYQADPDHLRAMSQARRVLERNRRLRVLYAGFAPGPRADRGMLDPRVLGLMQSPRPECEWHSGEMETAVVLSRRPELVRRGIARRLPPVWLDFRGRLRAGARRFRDIDPRARAAGYFGWPAAARPETGEKAMALRGKLIARDITEALGRRSRPRGRPHSH